MFEVMYMKVMEVGSIEYFRLLEGFHRTLKYFVEKYS